LENGWQDFRSRRGFTPAEREQFKPPIYEDILAWVRAQLCSTTKDSHLKLDFTRSPQLIQRILIPGIPVFVRDTTHPYDTVFPHNIEDRIVDDGEVTYSGQLWINWLLYRKHVEEPWTEAEARLLASDHYIPCCQMERCHRMRHTTDVFVSTSIHALFSS
jgi:hypothetical protein